MNLSTLKVGDDVLIASTSQDQPRAPIVGRWAKVEAIRALSFDAGGLCFRNDGTEWCGYHRVHMILPKDREEAIDSLFGAGASSRVG